jgi:hypothetical protein
MNESRPLVLALGGYSEAGKSSAGRHLLTRGFARVKIASLYRRIYKQSETILDFVDWSNWIDRNDARRIGERFLAALRAELDRLSSDRCTIESLYGDTLARELKRDLGDRFKVLFIDIDYETRLKRQREREGFATIEEARAHMDPRDEMKRGWGADRVRDLADFVVDNSGTLPELHKKLDRIAEAVSAR